MGEAEIIKPSLKEIGWEVGEAGEILRDSALSREVPESCLTPSPWGSTARMVIYGPRMSPHVW